MLLSSYLAIAFGAVVTYIIVDWYLCFRRNLLAARASGLKYVIVPVFFLQRFWLVTHRLWIKILATLPIPDRYLTWVDFCLPEFSFDYRHEIFRRVGVDTFLTVSPGGNSLWTAEPSVISQITTRRNDFPKPTHIYKSVDIYGKNVVSTEGSEWRYHRKATSPPFTEKNNHLVWAESIAQSEAMLSSWTGKDRKGNKTIDRIMDDTMRLSLYVISRAGFGRHLEWPTEETKASVDVDYVDPSKIVNDSGEMEEGHTMSYTYAIHCLLDNILFQFLFPRWMLKKSPFKIMRKANEAFEEFGRYMQEMMVNKKAQIKADPSKGDEMDILGQLVKGQLVESKSDAKSTKSTSAPALSDEHILGNSFVLILAGHETAANSIHFSLLYLAMHIPSQRRLQRDLDSIFGGREPKDWDYDTDLPQLFGGMTGAILNEELRLVPPVVNIPKSVTTDKDQELTVDGKKCVIPKGCYVSLCTVSVQRNAKYWPVGPPSNPGGKPAHPVSNLDNDLEEFRPERWLLNEGVPENQRNGEVKMETEKIDAEGIGVNEAHDTSERLYRPPKGAYIPFSDGYRACLGRRFAQVEILVTLAVIFQKYSVELAVDQWASDEEVIAMDEDAKAEVWAKAAERCRDLMLNGMGVIITLQMRSGTVALRFVPRGSERFADDVEEVGRRVAAEKGQKLLKVGETAKRNRVYRAWVNNQDDIYWT